MTMTLLASDRQASAVAEGLPLAEWRMVVDYDMPGDYLMALDEALLESVIAGAPPVVRFYTWQPATLSLGVNQALREIDRQECEQRGFGLVRRLTGGRAVLHQHELTYSVIAREHDPRVSGGVIESYRKISAALVDGLHVLGLDASLAAPSKAMFRAMAASRRSNEQLPDSRDSEESMESAGSHGAVCFDAASAYEVTVGGRKLVGSAQARRGGAILQHGSILLDIDWDAWVSVFAYATPAGKERAYSKLPTRMTSLRQELGRPVGAQEVQAALTSSFERTMNISLLPANLTAHEQSETARLATEKYGAETWIAKI
jgi:lipoyl(octanoyl) transferase